MPSVTEQPFELLEKHQHYKYKNLIDLTFHAVLHLDAQLDPDVLRRALRQSLAAYPIMGCTVRAGLFTPRWVRRDDLDRLELCDVEETDDVEAALQRYYRVPCRPWDGDPLVHARLVRHGGRDVLAFKLHHAVSDAEGLRHYVYAVAEIYSRLLADPGYRAAPVAYHRGLGPLLAGMPLAARALLLSQTARDRRARFDPPVVASLPLVTGDRATRCHLNHHVAPARVAALRAYARRRGASLNDVMNALFGTAVRRQFAPGRNLPLRFASAFDLRRYDRLAAGVEGPRNLAQLVYWAARPTRADDFDELVRLCRAGMGGAVAGYGALASLPVMRLRDLVPIDRLIRQTDAAQHRLDAHVARGGTVCFPIVLSNLGVSHPDRARFGEARTLRAYTPPFVYHNYFFFAFGTYAGELTVSVGFHDPPRYRPVVATLLGLVDEEIARCGARA